MFIFLHLVDLDLTYFGWCLKVIPFSTDYDHQGSGGSLVLATSQKSLTLEGHHK